MTGGYAQQTPTPEGGVQTQPPQTGMYFTSLSSLLLWQTVYIVYGNFLLLYPSKTVDQMP